MAKNSVVFSHNSQETAGLIEQSSSRLLDNIEKVNNSDRLLNGNFWFLCDFAHGFDIQDEAGLSSSVAEEMSEDFEKVKSDLDAITRDPKFSRITSDLFNAINKSNDATAEVELCKLIFGFPEALACFMVLYNIYTSNYECVKCMEDYRGVVELAQKVKHGAFAMYAHFKANGDEKSASKILFHASVAPLLSVFREHSRLFTVEQLKTIIKQTEMKTRLMMGSPFHKSSLDVLGQITSMLYQIEVDLKQQEDLVEYDEQDELMEEGEYDDELIDDEEEFVDAPMSPQQAPLTMSPQPVQQPAVLVPSVQQTIRKQVNPNTVQVNPNTVKTANTGKTVPVVKNNRRNIQPESLSLAF